MLFQIINLEKFIGNNYKKVFSSGEDKPVTQAEFKFLNRKGVSANPQKLTWHFPLKDYTGVGS